MHTCVFVHLPIFLHCQNIIIFLGREVAHVENNCLGGWLNVNLKTQSVVRNFCIEGASSCIFKEGQEKNSSNF